MAKRYRVGIVGLDHWYAGLGAVDHIASSPRAELVAIAHRDEAKGRATAERVGAETFTTDYEAVATRGDLDIVITACYTSENARFVSAAARAGSNVISVKPIAMTPPQADEIANAVAAAGVKFMSAESNYRVSPAHMQIKAWVDGGKIGKVISAYTVLRSGLPMQVWPGEQGRTWWLDATKTPGGGWLDHSIYHIDFLRWLIADEVVRVSGKVANLKYQDISPLEDYGFAHLEFTSGAIASIEVTWTGAAGAGLHQIHIVGTEGQIVWDPTLSGKTALSGKTDPQGWLLVGTPPRGGHTIDHMIETIESGGQTAATVKDARTNLAICDAFYRAAREGRTIAL